MSKTTANSDHYEDIRLRSELGDGEEYEVEDSDEGLHLFIFGLGNVGKSVADLSSKLLLKTSSAPSTEDARVVGLHAKNGAEEELRSSSRGSSLLACDIPVFRTICATVRTKEEDVLNLEQKDYDHTTQMRGANVQMPQRNVLVEQVLFDDKSSIAKRLADATHVLVTIPPVMTKKLDHDNCDSATITYATGGVDKEEVTDQECNFQDTVLSHGYGDLISNSSVWVGYVSTTGVYGDHGGDWVDEQSDLKSTRRKTLSYARIESEWCAYGKFDDQNRSNGQRGPRVRVFRCSGLYGADRSALHTAWKRLQLEEEKEDDYLDAKASSSVTIATKRESSILSAHREKTDDTNHDDSFTSRIHLDDVARAIVASMLPTQCSSESNVNGLGDDWGKIEKGDIRIYNLADDEPASRDVVMDYAVDMIYAAKSEGIDNYNFFSRVASVMDGGKMKAPHPQKSDGSDRAKRRISERKRVSNHKMKQELLDPYGGLLYGTYREGLASLLGRKVTE